MIKAWKMKNIKLESVLILIGATIAVFGINYLYELGGPASPMAATLAAICIFNIPYCEIEHN
jgi:hypothetical protein